MFFLNITLLTSQHFIYLQLTATNWLFSILMMSPTTTLCHRSSTSFPSRNTYDKRLLTKASFLWRCYHWKYYWNFDFLFSDDLWKYQCVNKKVAMIENHSISDVFKRSFFFKSYKSCQILMHHHVNIHLVLSHIYLFLIMLPSNYQ